MKSVVFAAALALTLSSNVFAQKLPPQATAKTEAKTPEISAENKAQLISILKDLRIASLEVELAQRNLKTAQESASSMIKTLQVEGYELDLQTLTYIKK